jgi:hypothetical protein
MKSVKEFPFYCESFLKIKTKTSGIQPFFLRDYQSKFYSFLSEIEGPKRIIALKPRQAGFSTLCAAIFFHRMITRFSYSGIAMADKSGRTLEVGKIYSTFFSELPDKLKPAVARDNTEELLFDKPQGGLKSGLLFESAKDPSAGRASSRLFAHLSEAAFYDYYKDIDDGVQNSIPLHPESLIIKESTANGRAGIGKNFYQLWQAAKRGESIYKPFFVSWFEIPDYAIDAKIHLTPYERELMGRHPGMTKQNIVWRRMKLMEYLDDEENSYLSPEERFCQDFPSNDEEAFLSSGSPVFPQDIITAYVTRLNATKSPDLKDKMGITSHIVQQFFKQLKIYTPPRQNLEYFIGADVSEGLVIGDSSSLCIFDQNYNQVGRWHGKIDPDLYGHLLAALGDFYCNAKLIVENNNMGHTTVTTLKNISYPNIYKKVTEDKVSKTFSTKYGWTTTGPSKQDMLNEAIRVMRERRCRIHDIRLIEQMGDVSRGENGNVNLNGKDRVVAFCLTMMGLKHYKPLYSITNKKSRELYDLGPKKSNDDIYA